MKRIDDVNLLASDVHMVKSFLTDTLGFRLRERKMLRDGTWAGAWLSVSALSHDIAIMHDRTGARGRLHHVCYYYGYPQHLWDVADICIDQGVKIEHGPGKHGTGQALFLCVIEPGGNRIELFGDVGYLVFEPDWQPVTWTEDDDLLRSTSWIGAVAPSEFYLYGTPPVGATSPPPNQPTAGRSTQS